MKAQLPLQTTASNEAFPPTNTPKIRRTYSNFVLFATRKTSHWQFPLNQKPTGGSQMRVFVRCPLEEINDLHSVWAAKVMNSPVQHTMKSFLNPYTAPFIVVFNNVWLPASRQSCPRCIYFLSDALPNNSVIPCGPTTQTAWDPHLSYLWPPASPLEAVKNSFPSLLAPQCSPSPTAARFLSFEICIPFWLLRPLSSHPLLPVDSHVWERLGV